MTSTDSPCRISADGVSAEIAPRGAELVRLQDEAGRDLLWNGDPAFWTGRAPLLFPIVGRLKDDAFRVGDTRYAMRQHGFARISTFECVAQDAASCCWRVTSNAETLAAYPFDFRLDVTYRVRHGALTILAEVTNTGEETMPVSFGYHPALLWPLPYGGARADHRIVFAEDEPRPLAALSGGLLQRQPSGRNIEGRMLPLTDDLFARDALIVLEHRSRSVRYGVEGRRGLRVEFPDMPQLGLWTKPGAGFICIEPWSGYASPEDFDGTLAEKPGMNPIPSGSSKVFAMSLVVEPAGAG